MTMAPSPPSKATLRLFLLGTLPPEEADCAAKWVEEEPDAADVLRDIQARDAIVDAISTDASNMSARFASTHTSGPDVSPAVPEPPIPTEVGGYRVVRELGRGGMGIVLEAEDRHLNRRVAIKMIATGLAANPEARERFLREARAVARIHHENVVPILHVGEDGGHLYLVMPLLVGETLDVRLKREKRLPTDLLMRVGRELAAGLAAAHAVGLIHRDVKPANIWLEAGTDRAKLLDFGLVKPVESNADLDLSGAGAIIGTPLYMAPEQAVGKPVDSRSDLFSLGAVLYHAATGERPFKGETKISVLYAVANALQRRPETLNAELPPQLASLICKLLEKDPARRPATAMEAIAQLQDVPALTVQPVREKPFRKRLGIAAGFLAAAVIAVAMIIIIRDKNGKEVARFEVPEGGSFGVNDEKPGKTPELADPNTEIAEYVLSIGGSVQLNLENRVYTKASELPKTSYQVSKIDLSNNNRIDAEKLTALRKCEGLVDFNAYYSNITDAALAHFLKCTSLRKLYLNDTQVGDPGLAHLKYCKNLFVIHLSGTNITDAGLVHLSGYNSLTEIYLSHTVITDDGLVAFKGCTELTALYLHKTKITGRGLAIFKNCRGLKHLDIGETSIGDADLLELRGMTEFAQVYLKGSQVTDAGLAVFQKSKSLSILDLDDLNVTDAGLANFKDCQALEVLRLRGTKVSDAGLAIFKDRKLRWLNVRKTRVTAATVNEWSNAQPWCRIESDFGDIYPKM